MGHGCALQTVYVQMRVTAGQQASMISIYFNGARQPGFSLGVRREWPGMGRAHPQGVVSSLPHVGRLSPLLCAEPSIEIWALPAPVTASAIHSQWHWSQQRNIHRTLPYSPSGGVLHPPSWSPPVSCLGRGPTAPLAARWPQVIGAQLLDVPLVAAQATGAGR